jgi:hypothetical protein
MLHNFMLQCHCKPVVAAQPLKHMCIDLHSQSNTSHCHWQLLRSDCSMQIRYQHSDHHCGTLSVDQHTGRELTTTLLLLLLLRLLLLLLLLLST